MVMPTLLLASRGSCCAAVVVGGVSAKESRACPVPAEMDYLGLAASLKDGHQQSRMLVTTSSLSTGWLTPHTPPPQDAGPHALAVALSLSLDEQDLEQTLQLGFKLESTFCPWRV